MFDELREIETAAIDELSQLKAEQEVLEERLARMEEEKEKVSEAVYTRVREDYASRTADLDEKAGPLKQEARREYAKLQVLHERLQSAVGSARLDKEELELRHRLGEYDDEAFQERLGRSEQEIEAREGELREAEELRRRFVDAFRSEEELEQAGDDAEFDGDAEFDADSEATRLAGPGDEVPPSADTDDTPRADGDETLPAVNDDRTTSTSHVETIPPPPPDEDGSSSTSEATVMLKGPRLVIHRNDSDEELRLGIQAITIGRGVKNDIRFLSTSVSRRHARIALGDDGYVVTDLGSGNGTLVNGEPVAGERGLREGDMIQVGSEVVVFRDR